LRLKHSKAKYEKIQAAQLKIAEEKKDVDDREDLGTEDTCSDSDDDSD
jgi:hypothetical protein